MKYILNNQIMFSPDEHKLSPLGPRGHEVLLHTPVSRILLLLLSRPGNIIGQDELFHYVWEKHGIQVTPNTLHQNVSLLRKALKKAGLFTGVIKTAPKKGFSFTGQVELLDENAEEATKQASFSDIAVAGAMDSTVRTGAPADIHNSEVPLPLAGQAIKEQPTQRKIKRSIKMIIATAVVVCALLILFFMIRKDKEFTAEQIIIGRVNGCPVYVDKGNRNADIQKISTYLQEKGISCVSHELLYIVKDPNRGEAMVLLCNSSDKKLECSLKLTLPVYLTNH